MKKLKVEMMPSPAVTIPIRPVVLADSELKKRETALADFLKVNGDTLRVVDETDGIFTPAESFEVYWVTFDKIKDLNLLGIQYGYRIYEIQPGNQGEI